MSIDDECQTIAVSANEVDRVAKEYVNPLMRCCASRIRLIHDREDIVQEVLFTYLKRGKVFTDRDYERNWLYKVCDNKIKDFLSQQYKQKKFEVSEESIEEIAAVMDNPIDEKIDLLNAIASLPTNQEEVVRLYYLLDCSTEEIAQRLGMTQQTVWNILSKARDKLRKKIEK
jgi:RNA polymerase sigma-70 factor (ECF subfamily)